jgi:hypothetical protein
MEVRNEGQYHLFKLEKLHCANIFSYFTTDVLSKYRFNLPTTENENEKRNTTLQHDNESDIIVRRKKNEFIEIGKCIHEC